MPKPKSDASDQLAAKSINPDEIDWFNKMAHEWWDPNGVMHMLHDYNHLRIPWIRDGLIATKILPADAKNKPNCLEGTLILDAGCGGGVLTEAIGRVKGKVVGLDCAKQLIDLAEDHLAPQDDLKAYVSYCCETIEEHCVKNPNKYDAVVASEVLEHIDDKAAFLDCCVKALKPGGSIFITTISKTFMGWFIAKLWAEYITGIIRRGSHEFKLFITPNDVMKILKEFNCRKERVRGVRYDFFRRREKKFQFSSYSGVAYTLQAVKNK